MRMVTAEPGHDIKRRPRRSTRVSVPRSSAVWSGPTSQTGLRAHSAISARGPCQRSSEEVDRVHGTTGRPRPNRQRRFVLPVGDPRLEYRAPTRSAPRQGAGPWVCAGSDDRLLTPRPFGTAPLCTPGSPISSSRRSPRSTRGATSDSSGGQSAVPPVPVPVAAPSRVALAAMFAPEVRPWSRRRPTGRGRSARHGWPRRWAGCSTGRAPRWPRSITARPTPGLRLDLDLTQTRAGAALPLPASRPASRPVRAPCRRWRAGRGHRLRAAPDRRRSSAQRDPSGYRPAARSGCTRGTVDSGGLHLTSM